MIAKQVQGSDFQKILNYIHNKSGARLIGSNMVGKNLESLSEEFRMSSDLRKLVTKCVYHVSLSVSPSEKLSKRVWIEIARAYLNGMEFKGNQYAIYRHTDREHDHIHIIASRIKITDGSVVSDSWNYRRSEKLVRLLEQQFGLSQTPCSWEKRRRSPTTGEMRRQERTGEVNKRSQLQTLIQQSLQDSPSLDQFIGRLTARGVSVRLRKSQEGKIQGISYGLDGIAFQGRQLGRDYSWTSLELFLAKEISYQSSQNHVIAQQDAIASGTAKLVVVTTIVAENQDTEDNKLEQQKKQLRAKYVNLVSQVRKFPQFQHRGTRSIDIGVILLALKSGEDLKEARMILTQSDTVKQWHQQLPRDIYLKLARQYIQQVTNQTTELIEKHRWSEKALEG
ncbi:relaxase/mobilization nuclease domain-containing protein [Pleurocapsales cyanobacterium LEGE 06147]|nr:relaxase/mobilization nuclease domain-containing protein [Pleurocapsales cyanobacterium LEGE 06147]